MLHVNEIAEIERAFMKGKGKRRSAAFEATRHQHGLEAAEDYTELIADLEHRDGEARVGTIAKELGVSHVTALRTIRRLQDEGFVTTSERQPVYLTEKGKQLSQFCKERHELLVEFLVKIGVPSDVAEIDVEGLEHHVSRATLECVKKHMEKL